MVKFVDLHNYITILQVTVISRNTIFFLRDVFKQFESSNTKCNLRLYI